MAVSIFYVPIVSDIDFREVDLFVVSGSAGRNPMCNKIKLNEFLPSQPTLTSFVITITITKKKEKEKKMMGSIWMRCYTKTPGQPPSRRLCWVILPISVIDNLWPWKFFEFSEANPQLASQSCCMDRLRFCIQGT